MDEPILLWSNGAPGGMGDADADRPTLTPFVPTTREATGAAVIVCPGGGYTKLADHEGGPVAEWLSTLGIAAFVLRYRHAPGYSHPIPLLDAARAVRTVRSRAGQWGLDPDRIGVLGFSAGGHLTTTIGTHFGAGDASAQDPVERAPSRPDFLIPVYAVISFREYVHQGCIRNLLGEDPPEHLLEDLSNDRQVTPRTPPAFLIHTTGDKGVPCEHSILFALALRRAGVEVEMHILEGGRHGFGLGADDPACSSWPGLCAAWLRRRGLGR